MTSLIRRTRCRLCASDRLERVLCLTPTPLADAYVLPDEASKPQPVFPLDVFLCASCGYTGLLDVVRAEEIYPDYIYETASSLGLVAHFQQLADRLVGQLHLPAEALAVDIGSNDGALLRALKAHGLRVLGVDPARAIAAQATAAGVETMPSFFTQALGVQLRRERGPATLITANNIIANVDDLDDVVAGVRELLAPDGAFVFETAYLADLMANMVFDFIYHEHLSYFSVRPLASFFRRHGMQLTHVERTPTKGGSMRCTVQSADNPPQASVSEFIAAEEAAGLSGRQPFDRFSARIESARSDFQALLDGVGGRVDGYGASATSTTLIYHFKMGPQLGALYDDYAAKQGRLSPGLQLPVLPSSQLYQRRPGAVVVLAWRYFEPIQASHREYLAQGGRFLIPLPEPRWL
jgi:SAM-dependent methyltransferase